MDIDDISYILAQVFGIYLIIMGIFWLVRRDLLQKAIPEFYNSPLWLISAGCGAILFGLFIMAVHPVFELSWRGLITLLFGLLPIVKGIIRLFFPGECRKCSEWMTEGHGPIYMGVISLLLGLFFSYYGFIY